ncbi:MAG: peptidyl-prolyl cis-trans isomerase SurA [Arenicella sp.]|jgi:peptidyl-prolyl cis-trans isomerase SurA
MRKLLFLFSFLIVATALFAQKDETLINIGNQEVPISHFVYLYEKNYGKADTAYNDTSLREYLDLFIKFKLKVAEANARKIDQSEAFKKEFGGYRKQLQRPYLSDKNITEGIIREAYERMKQEVKAAHILIKVEDWDNPADTLKAYKKAMKLRNQVVTDGKDFGELAQIHSDDPSAKSNKGDLGYFTSMQMVYEFEDAAYKLKEGAISMPVKTRFGYHVIKVADKIEARGSRKVAHIMVRATAGMDEKDSLEAYRKIQEIASKLKSGAKWDELAHQFSDDNNSKEKGGKLPWLASGQVVPAFSNTMFALKNLGDVSEPLKTPFGWHIIRLDSIKNIKPFEEVESDIKKRISSDSRSELSKKLFLDKLKKENELEIYDKRFEDMYAVFDSSLVKGLWKQTDAMKIAKKKLFKIQKEKYYVRDYFSYAQKNQFRQKGKIDAKSYAQSLWSSYIDKAVMDYEIAHLEEKYPDYRNLVREYREGLMLFEIMEKEVWGKSIEDTMGLKEFYEANKENYKWGERAKVNIFSVSNEALLKQVKADLQKEIFVVEELDLRNLVFSLNDTTLDKTRRRDVDKVGLLLRRNKDYSVEIRGGFVEGETVAQNKMRLKAIKIYLTNSYKIEADRIKIIDLGKREGKVNKPSNAGGNADFIVLSTSPKALESKYNKKDALSLQTTEGWFEKGELASLKNAKWEVGEQTMKDGDRFVFIQIKEIDKPRLKKLNETKGQVISDFQDYLEKLWIAELKKKFPVKVETEKFEDLIKK